MLNCEFQDLSISLAGAKLLDREFRRALDSARDNEYIERPKALDKFKSRRRTAVSQIRNANTEAEALLRSRAEMIQSTLPDCSSIRALDLAAQSILWESNLCRSGAIYGERPWNFCLTPLSFPKQTLEDVGKVAITGFNTLLTCRRAESDQYTPSETYLNSLNLKPNGARVDILLTKQGPKIIEVNVNWVDAIQALAAFQTLALGNLKANPVKILTGALRPNKGIAVVNIAEGRGSRAAGPQLEMEALAKSLSQYCKLPNVEVVNPYKIRPEYLSNFDSFYVNGDPRMLAWGPIPDWLERTYGNRAAKIFPNWNPGFDRKRLLVEASGKSDSFISTLPLERITEITNGDLVLKGESFSSQKVAFSNSGTFESLLADARLFPQEYTVQPAAEIQPTEPVLAFDTSGDKPVYITGPNYKFNVWIIGGSVAGMLVSVSGNRTISDKDYNGIPIPV